MKFLEKHGREAVNALFYEMTDEEILELEREDGYLMGHEDGVKEGREEGIFASISICKKLEMDEESIIGELCEGFSLTREKACELLLKYKETL